MAYATEAARIHCITVAIAERNFLVVAAEGIHAVIVAIAERGHRVLRV